MSSQWRTSTWGDEVSLDYGKALRNYAESPCSASGRVYRVYGSNGPIGWTDKPLAPGPGVILGRKGAYRGINFSPDPFFVIDTAYYLRPKHEADMRWLYYAAKHHQLGEIDDGSPIPSTTRAAVNVRRLVVPPLPEQKRIARILGALDDKIENNRRMNATLEAMARALFKSWFIDFDPVRAKIDGRQPPGMDPETAALFPDLFQESELGPIPEGWDLGTVADLAQLENRVVSPSTRAETIWEHFSIPAFDANHLPTEELGSSIKSNKFEVPAGSLLVSKLNPATPRVWMPNPEHPSLAICSTEFLPLVPTQSWYHPYLYELLKADTLRQEIISRVGGSTGSHQRISPSDLLSIPVILPSPALFRKFHGAIAPLHSLFGRNLSQSKKLATTRAALLPYLMSGGRESTLQVN